MQPRFFFLLIFCAQSALAGEFDVVINEIQYHPVSGHPGDEFIELLNQGSTPVDLSDWQFSEGVVYLFPEGAIIPPGGFLVASPDRARTLFRYGISDALVVGNYIGRLSRDGEALRLDNAAGKQICRVHYRDGGSWPDRADGLGSSLELASSHFDIDLPEAWRSSRAFGGTPGAANSTLETVRQPETLVGPGEEWRYFKGTADPAPGGGLQWADPDLDDSSWLAGPAPFGYGLPEPQTQLGDMQAGYTTLFLRKRFELGKTEHQALLEGRLRLEAVVGYDDGFLLLLNGVELARVNAPGNPGDPLPAASVSIAPENTALAVDLGRAGGPLREGLNTLAIAGVNAGLGNRDFLLAPMVQSVPLESSAGPATKELWINEVRPGSATAPGFIELYHDGAEILDLGGVAIREAGDAAPFIVAAGVRIASRGFRTFRESELGFKIEPVPNTFILIAADGKTLLDALPAAPGSDSRSSGRYPDGDGDSWTLSEPTEDAPNRFVPEDRIVINEIHYHSQSGNPLEEFIELFNRSGEAVPLSGWRFTRGIDFTFPPVLVMQPGSHLVVAQDPEAFKLARGIQNVTGGHTSGMKNNEEELVLVDSLGNTADRVHYADDGAWPPQPDGAGPSLELVNDRLDNRYGAAWRAGPAGGTPGALNSARLADPAPVAVAVRHEPAIPSPDEPVSVRCRVLGAGPPAQVILDYQNDSGNGSGSQPMLDDGQNGDQAAGDGLFHASIPPFPEGALIRFRITCRNAAGSAGTAPPNNAYFLYEVHEHAALQAGAESYMILLTEAGWRELTTRGSNSDALLDATFIDVRNGEVFYNVGLRYRGNSSRNPPDNRPSYRVQFSHDQKFNGVKRLNLNSQNSHRQILGNDLFRRAGIPYPQSLPALLRIHRRDDAQYLRVEALDEQFLKRIFDADDEGNLYRGLDGNANLTYLGTGFGPYANSYEKVTNQDEGDFSDLVGLTQALELSSNAEYVAEVEKWIDVEEWVMYFAANGVMGNNENSIALGAGDDYYLYRRPSDGRFLILPWDADSMFVEDAQVLFRPTSPSVARLLKHPRYAPMYYCALLDLAAGPMAPVAMAERLERLQGIFSPQALGGIENFIDLRQAFLERSIPRELTAGAATGGSGDAKIPLGADWSFFRGRSAPSAEPLGWAGFGFDDSSWEVGPSGFGFGDNDDLTVLGDMENAYTSVFIRRHFTTASPAELSRMILEINYDDGFVAYLNGSELARRQVSGAVPVFSDVASGAHEITAPPESIDVSGAIGLLRPGDNVLALVGFNATIASTDFSLAPVLRIETSASGLGCGFEIYTSGDAVTLTGLAPACGTAGVRINDAPAVYTPWQARWQAEVALAQGSNIFKVQAVDAGGVEISSRRIEIHAGAAVAPLPALVEGSLTLTAAGSPYLLSGDLTVPAGARLACEPGTVILVGPGGRLVAQGQVEALGTPEQPVVFRRARCGESWRGISISGTGADGPASRFRSCDFRFPGNLAGGVLLQVNNAAVELVDCALEGDGGTAVDAVDASLSVSGCGFGGWQTGIHAQRTALSAAASTFERIQRDALLLEGAGSPPALVRDCRFRELPGAAVTTNGVNAAIEGTSAENCRAGLQQQGGRIRLERSWIAGCLTGAVLAAGAILEGDHATLAGNYHAFEPLGTAVPRPQLDLDSCIVWGNRHVVAPGAPASISIAYSCVEGDSVWPGQGNIDADPRFEDFAHGDYRLQAGSPALGAGRAGSDMGAFTSGGHAAFFIRGDCDRDGELAITDAVTSLLQMFLGAGAPRCQDACDADDSGELSVTDPIYLLNNLFLGGEPIPGPYPEAGADPTADALTCDS